MQRNDPSRPSAPTSSSGFQPEHPAARDSDGAGMNWPARTRALQGFGRAFALVMVLASACPTLRGGEPERITYRNPGLRVDLGVGLWAWPLPVDADGDGDLDLIVSCPDKPYNGTYLFENPGTGMPMPVFKPGVQLSQGSGNIGVSYVDGKPRVLTPNREHLEIATKGVAGKSIGLKAPGKIPCPYSRFRARQWSIADFDGDGMQDLIVGLGCWSDYGWDNAFDSSGTWTRGPLHGLVYLIRNKGTNEESAYEEPIAIEAGGARIDVYGMPSPNLADFDADGDLDIICGEFIDGFTYFQNTGSRTKPNYAAGQRLTHNGQPLAMHVCMITPTAVDWDGDGDPDLICGDEDGRVAFIENTGRLTDGVPAFQPPRYFQQEAADVKFGALVTPWSFDWDGDGDEDLVCGNTAGNIALFENLDGGDPPRWAAPKLLAAAGKPIRIMAGPNGSIQGPCETKWGYTTLSVADWDGDELPDLIVNSIWGKVVWYRNTGTRSVPALAASQPIEVAWPGPAPKPAWTWWTPDTRELATQWRTTPVAIDWDRDGLADLVMLDHEGYLCLYRRELRNGTRVLLPPERVFCRRQLGKLEPLRLNGGKAGRSGRRKICFADWDGDGDLDLFANSRNVQFLQNEGTQDGKVVFASRGDLCEKRLAGHTTSPTVVDWNRDGRPDILAGAEDGYLYLIKNTAPRTWTSPDGALTITGYGVCVDELRNGGTAFANRKYVWLDVPAALEGARFTQLSGGANTAMAVSASRDTTVYACTALGQPGAPDMEGWTRHQELRFRYTDGGKTPVDVLSRRMRAGEGLDVPQGNWTGVMIVVPKDGTL